jgi:PIN domain nuclease of toxin-antitoxin system
MSRILLDTTYLLPVAGIQIRGVEGDTIRRAKSLGHQLFISEISLFELAAKGAKLAKDGLANKERLTQAVQSLVSDESLGKVGAYEDGLLQLAVDLRQNHSDFVDCLILATAVSACEMLVTEDELLTSNNELMATVRRIKPEFVVASSRRLLGNRKTSG